MKARRQLAIMEIISNQRITTQEELGEVLKSKGFKFAQATVSRDIKELQLIKLPDEQGYYYGLPEVTAVKGTPGRMSRVLKDAVLKLDYSGNIIVIKTMPGAAQSVASLIDNSEIPNILGSVAGDDTIFVVVKPENAAPKVVNEFNQMIYK